MEFYVKEASVELHDFSKYRQVHAGVKTDSGIPPVSL